MTRQLTLRSGLLLVVVASMLPIGFITVTQALNVLDYNRTLIGNRLATSALATAARERDPLIIAERAQMAVSRNEAVRSMGPGCHEALVESLADSPALVNFARLDADGRVRCSALPAPPLLSFRRRGLVEAGGQHQGLHPEFDGPKPDFRQAGSVRHAPPAQTRWRV